MPPDHELTAKSLYAWKTRLVRLGAYSPDKASNFIPVKADEVVTPSLLSAAEPVGCRVILASGAHVEFMGTLTPATVRLILSQAGNH